EPPSRESAIASLDLFVERCRILMRGERIKPRVVSAHYWMSGVAAGKLTGAPMILSYHTVEARKVPPPGAGEDPLSSNRREREAELAREAARIVCFSEYDLAENCRLFPELSGKGVVIPPGVDDRFRHLPPRVVARSYLGLPQEGMIFLLAARGDAGKNAGAAIAAFRSMRVRWKGRATFLVAGQESADRPPGEDVLFFGSLPHAGMPMLFSAADAVVSPSLYESFGLVPLEALAAGVPVVVPERTYWGEKIRAEGGGLVYAPAEPEGLSGALLSLASSPELRARLSLQGPPVAAPFTWERCTASWEALLSSVSTP
ncbi:MAG TPA: glycosyltransferase family 4 protein, partial [Candidatus Deferrimicrobiaceae bacterium]|nr:glycosyltransferase family 4 protein [Candidatus Deferrimicrobiaceae bacterium]